ncbi:long-chain fatty acid--CoA ligase [Salinadaptatus halalkaliphilus]|uniref:Long-chain fatty acid--CoA ligase n=1 Tax=Salinadaptatus halalkaliphilus TaxID=2419781 RepID=A0A4S3TM37_9EURY|nr:AMP-binding protein [Salinadaptatus halalkaliphilus]THE64065.1 long-chain fatty acid--CoA ligase [Salinadaptatus halalkaliphilus]
MDGLTVGDLVETNARKYPDDECLVSLTGDTRETITFLEFEDRVNRIARVLADRGVSTGDRVAVYMQNHPETIATYYGAMTLGALPVPINHRFKDDEVSYVLEDSEATFCVFDEDAAEIIATVANRDGTAIEDYLYLGEEAPAFAESYHAACEGVSADRVEVVPDRLDPAALMYTSGTTGKPKGCVLTHDNIIQNSVNTVYSCNFRENEDRFLVVTPLFHIAAVALFTNTFYCGSTTYLLNDFVPKRVMEVIDSESITGSFFVPMMSRALLDVDGFDDYDLSSFEHYMTGAAPSERELKEAIIESFDANLYEVFGQTEMSPVTCLLSPEDALTKPDSIGKSIINVSVKVVDDDGQEVEPGEIGRIAYKGPTAFSEYLGMPEKTDEVFDEGYFVSSDLVRQDEEGYLYFVGRHDDMIVSGGENIHPAEIEEVLHEHEAISEVAVVGVPDEEWTERVRAAVVPQEDESLTAEAVTEYVGERIADYKKPREVVFYDELPRNPTGKIVKGQLQ